MKKLLVALTALTLSAPVLANWHYVEKIDPMTDADSSIVAAADGRSKALMFNCRDGEMVLLMKFDYLGSKANSIKVRFDKEKPFDITGGISTNGNTIFINPEHISDFTAKAIKHSNLAVLTSDYNGTPVRASYSLVGFADKINKLSCYSK